VERSLNSPPHVKHVATLYLVICCWYRCRLHVVASFPILMFHKVG